MVFQRLNEESVEGEEREGLNLVCLALVRGMLRIDGWIL